MPENERFSFLNANATKRRISKIGHDSSIENPFLQKVLQVQIYLVEFYTSRYYVFLLII